MRILVTGAGGFVGGRLCARLRDLGHEVVASAAHSGGGSGDLRDAGTARRLVEDARPEAVIHLAAISPVAVSYEQPAAVLETNFVGTVNLAEACARTPHPPTRFLLASSSEVYGASDRPRRETDRPRPLSPYALSKAASESYLEYLGAARGFPYTNMRLFNTYGRVGDARYVVERTISQMLAGEEVRLGSPTPTRDFLHVDDHVEAYLACLADERSVGQTLNFCTGRATSIRGLADRLAVMTGFRGEVQWNAAPPRPTDIEHMVGDPSKTRDLVGWRARVSLEEGLERTVKAWRSRSEVA